MTTLVLLIILIILGSALFSGLEAALFAVPMSRVHVLADKQRKGSEHLRRIKEKINRPIVTIVIGNNITNIVGSILVGYLAAEQFGSVGIGIVSAALTFAIIIFGEIIPKTIGENYAEEVSLFCAPTLERITKILKPIVDVIELVTKPFTKNRTIVSEEEIQMMSHLGTLEGTIEDDEREMIDNVFALNDYTAEDLMIPLSETIGYEAHVEIGSIKDDILELTHSTVPVYISDMQNICGISYRVQLLRALARDEHKRKVDEYLSEAFIIPGTMRADHLLPLFRKKRGHFAVVQDQKTGRNIGIITLEDVLEELVGDINDNTDA